jgi:hypothetical protein
MQRRDEQQLNLKRRSNVEALLAHVSGIITASPCTNCHKGHGPWTSCVVVDGQMCGSCSNCWYNASGARCSFHGECGRVFSFNLRVGRVCVCVCARASLSPCGDSGCRGVCRAQVGPEKVCGGRWAACAFSDAAAAAARSAGGKFSPPPGLHRLYSASRRRLRARAGYQLGRGRRRWTASSLPPISTTLGLFLISRPNVLSQPRPLLYPQDAP